MHSHLTFATLIFFLVQNGAPNLRKTALKSATPSDEIVRLDINKDGKPDILERWWNGKRVRWLDENGDMLPTDTRGDQIADVMQIDKNGDGLYDSALDINIKWADNDGDGRADLQAFVTQGREWSNGNWNAAESHWMVFVDVEKDGVLGWHLKEQETMPELAGTAQWIFKDFATTLRPGNPVPRVNQKGLVERDFTLKEGYFVFQSYWAEKPMVHIYGHSWPVRWGDRDEVKLLKVYSNCPSVELFVNSESVGVKQRNSQDFPAAGLRWLVKFKEGENVVRAVARRGKTEIVDELKLVYQTEKWGKPAKLVLEELRVVDDVSTVQVTLLDAKDVMCLDARNVVRFALAGDGRLIDNLGTSITSRKVELYNGRAMISVSKNGKSVVSVSCDGLPTAFLTI